MENKQNHTVQKARFPQKLNKKRLILYNYLVMVNYPNGKKASVSLEGLNDNHARRGMSLEDDINTSNSFYLSVDKAVIYKKPTPIQIVHVDYKQRSKARIDEAYFRKPSTTDYNGVYRGLPVDFEAKETHSNSSFPTSLVQAHQLDHLERVLRQNAVAFVLVRFSTKGMTFYVEADKMINVIRKEKKKSLPLQWFLDNAHLVPSSLRNPVDYLTVVDQLYKE